MDPLPSLRSPGMTPSFTRCVIPGRSEAEGKGIHTTVTGGTSVSLPLVGRAKVGV